LQVGDQELERIAIAFERIGAEAALSGEIGFKEGLQVIGQIGLHGVFGSPLLEDSADRRFGQVFETVLEPAVRFTQERDGKTTYRGHGIFGWDAQTKTHTWYWVDSLGIVPPSPSRGNWNGDTIVFESDPQGARRGRYTFALKGDDTYDFKIENTEDEGRSWHTFMEATYKRR